MIAFVKSQTPNIDMDPPYTDVGSTPLGLMVPKANTTVHRIETVWYIESRPTISSHVFDMDHADSGFTKGNNKSLEIFKCLEAYKKTGKQTNATAGLAKYLL